MTRRIVIIGGGAAGTTAAIQARKSDRSAEISLIQREELPEYSRCGLPYVFSGIVEPPEKLVTHPPSFYESVLKINLEVGTEAVKICQEKSTVKVRKVGSDATHEIRYDQVILATGARASLLPIKGIDKKGVFVIRTLDDVRQLAAHVPKTRSKTVTIIGAGLIGMEMAEALLAKDFKVVILELLPEILPSILDPDMASIVRESAERAGARVIVHSKVKEIAGEQEVESVITEGDLIDSQTVIVAANVKPNTDLANQVGIAVGETGGIIVDDRMRTSVSDIYAAGDCVETKCAITGRKILMQLATTAVRQAAVAGSNAAGGNEVYNGTTGVATTRLFEHEIASVGLTTAVATRYDLPTLSGRVAARSRLEYMPKGTEIIAKLICKSADGQLVGAQIIGEGASLRANFASQAIRFRMNISDFQAQETCYAPPNAPVWDPLTLAAQALQRKLEVRQARHDA